MPELPRVLVGGFARSGTSFLCNLIEVLGFSAGEERLLKGGAPSNPRGYWEFLPIRKLTWGAIGVNKTVWQHKAETMPNAPLRLEGHRHVPQIRRLARKYNVEVYKDNYLPLVHTMFPKAAKAIIIRRDWQDIHASHMRVRMRPDTQEQFRQAIAKFYRLADMMAIDRECLYVRYEYFRSDFDVATRVVAGFLGVNRYNVKEMRAVWSPNKK
jgi:hypothetical protein